MNFKFTRALLTGKIGAFAISLIDKNRGTIWAGKKAMKIDPDFFSGLSGMDPSKVLFVTGTNGKSTVTNMIVHILTSHGYTVTSNTGGANLISGVAAALVKGADLKGRISSDFCVFETDERYLHQIREQVPCANLLVTNLEKDQVQRNGDPDFVYSKIAAVADAFDMRLFLNGSEPRSCSLSDYSDKVVFYSADRHSRAFTKDDTFVTLPCPKCRSRIVFDYYNNDGMGSYRCEKCGYTNNNGRTEPDYEVSDVDFDNRTFTINGTEFTMPYDQSYMLYNYAAAVAVCKELAGISEADSAEALSSFTLPEGRIENFEYNGAEIKYFRFKQENPETLQNFLNEAAADPSEKVIIIGFGTVNDYDPYYINSFYAFDCDYSVLADANVRKIIFVTDTIAYDAANCFIYGGFDPSKIEVIPTSDVKEILDAAASCGCTNIYLTVKMYLFEQMKDYVRKNKH